MEFWGYSVNRISKHIKNEYWSLKQLRHRIWKVQKLSFFRKYNVNGCVDITGNEKQLPSAANISCIFWFAIFAFCNLSVWITKFIQRIRWCNPSKDYAYWVRNILKFCKSISIWKRLIWKIHIWNWTTYIFGFDRYGLVHITRTGSVLATLCVTIERFFAIVYPLKMIKKTRFLIIISLFASVSYNIPRFFEFETNVQRRPRIYNIRAAPLFPIVTAVRKFYKTNHPNVTIMVKDDKSRSRYAFNPNKGGGGGIQTFVGRSAAISRRSHLGT